MSAPRRSLREAPSGPSHEHEISEAMSTSLLQYYQAIEKASQDMLKAARQGDWDQVLKLEGACALLISQLKHNAAGRPMGEDEAQFKSRIMQRILVNDAEIRQLAEPWLDDLDNLLAARPKTIH
jgi:flagellar protein FliT